MNDWPVITLLTLTPLAGGFVVAGLDPQRPGLARGFGLVFSFAALMIVAVLMAAFDPSNAGFQFVERHAWIPTLDVDYFVAVDGLGLVMVLLTALLVPFALLATPQFGARDSAMPYDSDSAKLGRRSAEGGASQKLYVALMLFLQAGLFGAFTALNFFHWFIFWELSLVPAFFLIKLWGGPRSSAAATQFFIYTFVGSVTLLLAMLAVFLATGSMDFIALAERVKTENLATLLSAKLGWSALSTRTLGVVVFAGALLGFAVKVPLMPFHTWLPAAYAEAPTPVTMVLTGAMSKMGVYGFLRILLPIFPDQMQWMATPLLWLAVATVVLSAFAAMAQRDLKRMFAYSSINHLGYCLLGMFAVVKPTGSESQWAVERAAALSGVVFQMFSHGITAAALFCFIGLIERRSGGLRGLDDFGGLRKIAPAFCGLMGIAVFASLGLPGLNGFIGEFLIFKGTFGLVKWAAALSTLGLLATAVFLLTMLQKVWNGPLNEQWKGLPDLTLGERMLVMPATVLMFVLGIHPQLLLQFINPTVLHVTERLSN
jgi:NADH-quinone oxidoreductase subunit M